MSLKITTASLFERLPLPDGVTTRAIAGAVARSRARLAAEPSGQDQAFAAAMAALPIETAANAPYNAMPPRFFELVLGPRRKFSCCLYARTDTALPEAEEAALAATALHAELDDGQDILELGCGWGALSLWMAETYPNARITAVTNMPAQRAFIEAEAARLKLGNLRVAGADPNAFDTEALFDRVLSVEMFEQVADWAGLLGRVRRWLRPDGRLFLHVTSHQNRSYRFDRADREDWIAQLFLTGGIMPSHALIRQFGGLFRPVRDWRWSGLHYQRTATDWLANFDRNANQIDHVLKATYGAGSGLWRRRWRLNFLVTAGLFGDSKGDQWGVSHYLLAPK